MESRVKQVNSLERNQWKENNESDHTWQKDRLKRDVYFTHTIELKHLDFLSRRWFSFLTCMLCMKKIKITLNLYSNAAFPEPLKKLTVIYRILIICCWNLPTYFKTIFALHKLTKCAAIQCFTQLITYLIKRKYKLKDIYITRKLNNT